MSSRKGDGLDRRERGSVHKGFREGYVVDVRLETGSRQRVSLTVFCP